jgi:hypothetical protein
MLIISLVVHPGTLVVFLEDGQVFFYKISAKCLQKSSTNTNNSVISFFMEGRLEILYKFI